MRIAYLVSAYPAVSHTFIRREIEAMRRRGAEIFTFSVRRSNRADFRLERDREELDSTRFILPASPFELLVDHLWALLRPGATLRTFVLSRRHRLPGLHGWLWAWFHFAEAIRLARMLHAARVTHLHNHFANSGGTVGLLASTFLDLPWSVTLHGRADFGYPSVALLADKIRRAAFVVAISHFGRASARCYMDTDIPDERIIVVRCGLDMEAMPDALLDRAPNDRFRLLSVGRLTLEKAQLGLIEAVAALSREGIDLELEIVGEGPERPRLEERIRAHGIEDRCRLLGARPETEVFERLQQADGFALSSVIEGLPVALMEAMALGVPVVAPRLAGIPELVEDGRTGLLFHPTDWSGLTDCLRRLIEDAPLRAKMVESAFAKVHLDHDVDRAVEPLWQRLTEEEAARG